MRTLVAGNWKMNTDVSEARRLAAEVVQAVGDPGSVDVALCPPYISLDAVFSEIHGTSIRLGAQDMHQEDSGAFTGAISASMLRSVGCHYVILGHSERRQFFGETDAGVNAKVHKAKAAKLVPIVCVGELLEERDAGQERAVVTRQVTGGLKDVKLADASELVLAYEPVWAIGTGRTASPAQAQEMHAHIRSLLVAQFGATGSSIQILYGGSVKPGNAAELFAGADVNGGLIGGASLKAADFAGIIAAG